MIALLPLFDQWMVRADLDRCLDINADWSHTIADFHSHCEYLSLHSDSRERIFTCLLIHALSDSVRNDDWWLLLIRALPDSVRNDDCLATIH